MSSKLIVRARATYGGVLRESARNRSGTFAITIRKRSRCTHRLHIVTHNFFPPHRPYRECAIRASRTTTTAYFAFLAYIDSLGARAHCNSFSHTSTYERTRTHKHGPKAFSRAFARAGARVLHLRICVRVTVFLLITTTIA